MYSIKAMNYGFNQQSIKTLMRMNKIIEKSNQTQGKKFPYQLKLQIIDLIEKNLALWRRIIVQNTMHPSRVALKNLQENVRLQILVYFVNIIISSFRSS